MSRSLLLILIFVFFSNCSPNKSEVALDENRINVQEVKTAREISTKQSRVEQEFNSSLEVIVKGGKFKKNPLNNQNNIGELSYNGNLKKIGKYKFSKFDDFEYLDVQPIFYNEYIIFFDKKGTIILYDQNQKVIWEKNFYSKNEKKLRPRLNFARHNDILIVTDDIAKYYAIDIETGDVIWSKNNTVPFNSEIKIKDDFFYTVDYKNILRSISIIDGKEIWSFKTEESLTKSNTKISVVIEKDNVYFNNSIGDITAVNIRSGQLVWQLPTQNNNISKNAFHLSSSKLVIDEGSILFSNNRNEFYSIDTITGLINWKNEINSNLRPVVIDKLIITVSEKGYLYMIDKDSGNIIRINNLHKNYNTRERKYILATGFIVAVKKVYLSNDDGKLIVADLNTGKILKINKISGNRISGNRILQPHVNNNNLFLIKNGSIVKYN